MCYFTPTCTRTSTTEVQTTEVGSIKIQDPTSNPVQSRSYPLDTKRERMCRYRIHGKKWESQANSD